MFRKEIQIKTNPLTILLVCCVLIITAVFCFTNVRKNMMFASLSVNQIDAVTIYEQSGDRSATLSQADVERVVELLQKVRLRSRSVRLTAAETFHPYYSVRLKSGKTFTVACYRDYYIVDGRGYLAKDAQQSNHTAIDSLYLDQLVNREYFPRNETGRG